VRHRSRTAGVLLTVRQRRLLILGDDHAEKLYRAGGQLDVLEPEELRELLDALAIREELGLTTQIGGVNFFRD